jgi:hypothetical protein
MLRFRLRTIFAATALASLLGGMYYFVAHIDDPYATVLVSKDTSIVLTDQIAIDLTASALRSAGLTPVRHWSISRNTLRPDDRISVCWDVRKDGYVPSYGVRLERDADGVRAIIHRLK